MYSFNKYSLNVKNISMIQLNIDDLYKDVAHILPKSMKKYPLLFLINLTRQITQSSCCFDHFICSMLTSK
jgi:hypothetical protein